jgi:type I restriction enzyme M protein
VNDWPRYVSFIMSVADLLRGDYKRSEYGRVMLPFVVLRRLDCVLEPTKPKVLAVSAKHSGKLGRGLDLLLRKASGEAVYNTSKLDFTKLLDDADNVATNLRSYIAGFSPGAVEVLDKFKFDEQIARLDEAELLYLVVAKFADIDLHPDAVSNTEMGYVFEELIRRFSEQSNEAAGEHFTPREVVALKVNLLFAADTSALKTPGTVRTLYDPAAGTGGMLSVAEDHLRELNADARLEVFGQELNDESYAICRSDMLLKGQDPSRIAVGNSLNRDAFKRRRFDYMISNPPYGVKWRKIERDIRDEHEKRGDRGRFGAGLPGIKDGSLLFLQHMISKMKPAAEGGSRISIVFNESPLFKGAADSGESRIRQWIVENDWLEAIVALPDQLFYNTGISTYIWLVTNHKPKKRQNKVQLIDARSFSRKLPKSLGEKRKELTPTHIKDITRIYRQFKDGEHSRVLPNSAFGYHRVTVERPLRVRFEVREESVAAVRDSKAFIKLAAPPKNAKDPMAAVAAGESAQQQLLARLDKLVGQEASDRASIESAVGGLFEDLGMRVPKPVKDAVWDAISVKDPDGEVVRNTKGRAKPDSELRDTENVPLEESVEDYFDRAVKPQAPDAWVDSARTKLGYSIPVTRFFYVPRPPRPIHEVDEQVRLLEQETLALLQSSAYSQVAREVGRQSVKQKDSGLPWLPTIPAHWSVMKLTRIATLGSGHTPSRRIAEYWENATIPWVTTGDVAQMRDDRIEYLYETRDYISELGLDNSAAVLRPADTVVLCRTASAGYSAIMGTEMATSQDFVTWTCSKRLLPRFLLVCLRAMRDDLLGRLAMGSTHKTIYMPDIESLQVPLPPVPEQQLIVDAVEERARTMDELADKFGAQTSLLVERRQALFAAAVSGQLLEPTEAEAA